MEAYEAVLAALEARGLVTEAMTFEEVEALMTELETEPGEEMEAA